MPNSRPKRYYRIFVSEKALQGLDEIMHFQLFIPRVGKHAQFSKFLWACANFDVQWADARPAHIREQDEDAARFNLAAVWNNGDPHLAKWGVTLPVEYLTRVALSHNICSLKKQQPLLEGARTDRPRANPRGGSAAICSAVIEAIGLRWLRPTTELPRRTISKQHRRVEYTRLF